MGVKHGACGFKVFTTGVDGVKMGALAFSFWCRVGGGERVVMCGVLVLRGGEVWKVGLVWGVECVLDVMCVEGGMCCASQCFFSSLVYTDVAILMRFVLADWGMGAELIAANVADFVDSDMGLGPFNCVGQDGEKWSFTLQQ